MTTFQGSCLCGEIAYAIEGEALGFYHCHCQRCRKANGTGHGSNIRIQPKKVKGERIDFIRGEEKISRYKVPEAVRFRNDFCSSCGSPLPRYFDETGYIVLPAGSLDHELEITPEAHIFCGSKASWACRDQLAEFDEYPE